LPVLVAGAGPAGLAATLRVHGISVIVAERMPRPGYPPHCTGIVSPWTATRLAAAPLAALESEGILEAVYEKAVFLDSRLRERCSVEAAPLAVKLDRPRLEQWLAQRVIDAGHRVYYGVRVAALSQSGPEAALEAAGGTQRLRPLRVLLATGGQTQPPRGVAAPPRCWRYYGLEERTRLAKRIDDAVFTTIHGSRLAPGFFAWLAPIAGGREAVVGVAAPMSAGLYARLQALKRLLSRRGIAEWSGAVSRRGGVIVRGPPARSPLMARGVAALGDLLCASKPYTGGGLYAIAVLAPRLAAWLEGRDGAGQRLVAAWRRLRRELLLQHAATRAAVASPSVFLRFLAAACRRASAGGCRIDYDRHSSLVKCLLGLPS